MSAAAPARLTPLRRLQRAMSVYDVDPTDEVNAHFSSQDPVMMQEVFPSIEAEAARDDCFPLLMKRKDGYSIFVLRNRPKRASARWVVPLLLVATFASMLLAGAALVQAIDGVGNLFSQRNLVKGLVAFALPLSAILAAREIGRRFVASRIGAEPPTPYFIPLPPPLSFMGTLGSLSEMRSPVRDRRSLALLGAVGSLCAFAAALIVLAVGLAASEPATALAGDVGLGESIAIRLAVQFSGGGDVALHPTAIAGWVGLFLVSIQLLPIAGLDGGMIARAMVGAKAGFLAVATLVVLTFIGIAFWTPWVVIALLLALSGLAHPQPRNELAPAGGLAYCLAALCAIVLAATFVLTPL